APRDTGRARWQRNRRRDRRAAVALTRRGRSVNSRRYPDEECAPRARRRLRLCRQALDRPYHGLVAVVVALVAGLLLGALVTALALLRARLRAAPPTGDASLGRPDRMPADIVLQLLPTAAVLVDAEDQVRLANAAAVGMGIVRGSSILVPELAQLVRTARRTRRHQVA